MTTTLSTRRRLDRADAAAAGVGLGVFAAAAVVGAVLGQIGHPVRASAAPLFAHWLPHVGPGTPLALIVAALVVRYGPRLAAELSWSRLRAITYVAAVGWILALALVDGVQRGLTGRLTTSSEYLREVGGIGSVGALLHNFTSRILDSQPDAWTTHVAGHPPGAVLVFVLLNRIGLGGGGWAAVACVLVGAAAAVAVPETVRLLGDERAARVAVPFAVLFPGAVWIGASADGLFAGVAACGVALTTHGLVRRNPGSAVAGGALLGCGVYLSYGLVLLAPLVAAAAIVVRRIRPVAWCAFGALVVAAAFTVSGFWWPDGYHLVVQRYYQGIASHRPYLYWVWANLAAVTACVGPAALAVIRRSVAAAGRRASFPACWALPVAAAVAVLAADLSGLSKAEVERIWLPFAVWFAAGAALLPEAGRRHWLAAQAVTALAVNHLLLTAW
jgi:hypothetical protein